MHCSQNQSQSRSRYSTPKSLDFFTFFLRKETNFQTLYYNLKLNKTEKPNYLVICFLFFF